MKKIEHVAFNVEITPPEAPALLVVARRIVIRN